MISAFGVDHGDEVVKGFDTKRRKQAGLAGGALAAGGGTAYGWGKMQQIAGADRFAQAANAVRDPVRAYSTVTNPTSGAKLANDLETGGKYLIRGAKNVKRGKLAAIVGAGTVAGIAVAPKRKGRK